MKNDEFAEYVLGDVLGDIPGVTSRKMFGGWGIYKDGTFFALIADGGLYFKVDDSTRKNYEALGSKPFVYDSRGKKVTMSYWLLPEEIIEDKDVLFEWVEKSVAAGRNNKKTKK